VEKLEDARQDAAKRQERLEKVEKVERQRRVNEEDLLQIFIRRIRTPKKLVHAEHQQVIKSELSPKHSINRW
jgi:hypothetical protein